MTLRGSISLILVVSAMVWSAGVSAQSTYNEIKDTVLYVDRGVKVYNPDSSRIPTAEERGIIISAQAGTLKKVQSFHMNGVNINFQDTTYGKTPMMWAVAAGQKEVFDYLLKAGAKTSAIADVDGYTVLAAATEHGNVEMVKALLSQEGENAVTSQDVNSCFLRAVQSRSKDICKAYIEHGLGQEVMNDVAAKCDKWGMVDMLDWLTLHGARLK